MKWVGLTGGLGSGKSTVAKILREKGFSVIDADRKAREVLEPGTEALSQVVSRFGPEILTDSGELNRSALAEIVFKNNKEKEWLENLVHPLVQKVVRAERQYLSDQGISLVFYDVPLLFEKNLEDQFDAVVLVYCDNQTQVERVLKRNNWTNEEVHRRLQQQIPMESKKNKTSYVIFNTDGLDKLQSEVDRVLGQVLSDLEEPVPS